MYVTHNIANLPVSLVFTYKVAQPKIMKIVIVKKWVATFFVCTRCNTRWLEYDYLNCIVTMLCWVIDKFEVSAGNAVRSRRSSAAMTVMTTCTTDVICSVIVIIRRTVAHTLVVFTHMGTFSAERQSRTIACATLGMTLQTSLTTHFIATTVITHIHNTAQTMLHAILWRILSAGG